MGSRVVGVVRAAAVLLVLAATVGWLVWLGHTITTPDRQRPCAPSTDAGDPPAPASVANPAELELRAGQRNEIAFGRRLDRRVREVQFDVSAHAERLPLSVLLATDVTPFTADDSSQLNRDMVTARAQYRGGRVVLQVCATRDGPAVLGGPGSYAGTVSIIDPRVTRVDLPFTITLAYSGWPFVIVGYLLVSAVALVWVWALRQPADPDPPLSGAEFWGWLRHREGFTAACIGTVAGFSALAGVYFSSATWGPSIQQIVTLTAAAFSAFVAAASAPRALAQSLRTSRQDRPADGSAAVTDTGTGQR